MKWIRIKAKEVNAWNEKLRTTNASFFQYPYYAAGYKFFFLSRSVYIKLIDDGGKEHGYACILEVGLKGFRFGLIIRGPVVFDTLNFSEAITYLKAFALKNNYIFLRINPDTFDLAAVLQADKSFEERDYFSAYKGSQSIDMVVENKPADLLLKSFRTDCRNKIRFVKDYDYVYAKVKTKAELKKVYDLFTGLGEKKNFSYRPFKSYLKIFTEGATYNLCNVYTASLHNRLVCAAFIVKDGFSGTYFSGAISLEDVPAKYSPANNLHYLIMNDCFEKENKRIYNLSYSAPGTGVHMFKTSFKPEVVEKPPYYTYVIKKSSAERVLRWQGKSLSAIRKKLRKVINIFNK